MLYARLAFVLMILSLAGLVTVSSAFTNDYRQLSPRKKKLKATPIPRNDKRRVQVKTYLRKGKTVRAHERWIKVKPH
jgi:Rieske Fe-S protein